MVARLFREFLSVSFVWLCGIPCSLALCLFLGLCFCVGLLFEPVLDVTLRLMIH